MTAVTTPQQPSKSEITTVLYGEEAVNNTILKFIEDATQGWDTYIDKTGLSIALTVEPIRKALADAKNKGLKIRAITEITKDNVQFCKEYMQIITELRHLDRIRGNFAASESEYIATAALQEAQRLHVIYSNVKNIVEQHQYLFESLWTRSIPAEQKIREIEDQVILGKTEVIRNPEDIQELFIDMVKSANYEVLLVLPTINAFYRKERMGILELLRQAAEREEDNKVNVKILTPRNDIIEKKIQEFRIPNIDIASYEEEEELQVEAEKITITTVTLVIVDRKESLVIEKTDDSKQNFIEAVGIATYSNSNPTVLSYISIFRSLWSQIKLYERVKEANIQLKLHDKMQKEFINMASHEIKTPTQAIIGYADLMQRHPGRREEILNAISRNAIRLQKLTNDILEATRIESQTLRLNKEQFDLDNLIQDIVEDYRSQIEKDERKYNIKILYTNQTKTYGKEGSFPVMVEADKERMAQVISNLLNNSLEFTKEGTISINLERIKQEEDDHKYDVVISVTDSGHGIDPEILPRLFTKFVTKSGKGTGLGLFISKSIVEAHDGRIWGENNANGKGATFTFSLPIVASPLI